MGLKEKLNRSVDKTATKKLPFLGISIITFLVILAIIIFVIPKTALNAWFLKIPVVGGWYAKLTKQTTTATAATSTAAVNS